MKKEIQILFFVFLVAVVGFSVRKLRFESMAKAHAETPGVKANLPAPTDMPIPPELLGTETPAVKAGSGNPQPPMPQLGLPSSEAKPNPTDSSSAGGPPSLPGSGLQSIQNLDPSLKLLSGQEFVYDPTGRRDPFKSFLFLQQKAFFGSAPGQAGSTRSNIPSLLQSSDVVADSLEAYDVRDISVAAIIWDVQDPKAMLQAPSNKMFMVHKHTKVGKNNGYVASIREGEVVVVETAPDGKTPTTRVLVLPH